MAETTHEPTVIDLAAVRVQRRRSKVEQMDHGIDQWISSLQDAGTTVANLAWMLAAPVRHRDEDLKEGIYKLLLTRLGKMVAEAVDDLSKAPHDKASALDGARTLAFSAFQTRMLTLACAEQERHEGK